MTCHRGSLEAIREGETSAEPRSRKLPVKSGSAGALPSQPVAFEIRL